jgi:beta-mannosidase
MNRFFAAMDQAVRSQNPDRVIKPVRGDYDPPAPGLPVNPLYTLWYFRNSIDFGLLHKDIGRR